MPSCIFRPFVNYLAKCHGVRRQYPELFQTELDMITLIYVSPSFVYRLYVQSRMPALTLDIIFPNFHFSNVPQD